MKYLVKCLFLVDYTHYVETDTPEQARERIARCYPNDEMDEPIAIEVTEFKGTPKS